MISKDNFYNRTIVNFVRCEIPERMPDYVSYSGSAYWYYKNRVRRLSDHWGIVSSCYWLIEFQANRIFCCGEAIFEDFRKNDLCNDRCGI